MKYNTNTALSNVTWLSEVILDGASAYSLITVANLTARGIVEECLHLLHEVSEVPDVNTDFNIGDAGVSYLDGGGSLGIDLQLEIPGTLAVAIEEIADDRNLTFSETVSQLIEEGLARIA